jgi:hypothetical protein
MVSEHMILLLQGAVVCLWLTRSAQIEITVYYKAPLYY